MDTFRQALSILRAGETRRDRTLRPVAGTPGAADRIPWTAIGEFSAALGALTLILVVLARLFSAGRDVDFVAVGAGFAALVVMTALVLRQRAALARAARQAAVEAELARTDHLTGLPNRLVAEAALDDLLRRGAELLHKARSGRGGQRRIVPYWPGAAYLAIDLDEFKPVNDGAGHAEGDRLLREVADILRAACGPEDLPARVGGDEFVILMCERDGARARSLACSVRDAMRAHRFEADGRRYRVSGSMGLARIAPSDTSADAVRAAADRGAYAAKENGRDAVYELATLDADPVRVEGDEPGVVVRALPGAAIEDRVPAGIAHRFVALVPGLPDRLELRVDPRGEPPPAGRVRRHLELLASLGSLPDPGVALSIVLPPVLGDADLEALEGVAAGLATRRVGPVTVLLELPRRREDHVWLASCTRVLKEAGVRTGTVCATHSLAGIGVLAPLEIDEVQLHLARAPQGTLEAYALLARACGWTLSVADVEDRGELPRLARAGVERAAGPAIAPPGPPDEVLRTLGRPLERPTDTSRRRPPGSRSG